ncbi:MAG: transposase family protein [Bacteroides sp.]
MLYHLKEFVSCVPEYRRTTKGNYKYKLKDILLLVILARLSKCITRAEIIQFGKHNLKRLQSMGILRKGIPSEPTLSLCSIVLTMKRWPGVWRPLRSHSVGRQHPRSRKLSALTVRRPGVRSMRTAVIPI